MDSTIIVIDCQNDFITGSLACMHAEEAVDNIIASINRSPNCKVLYSTDWHSPNHCSFVENGGTWPLHCVAGTLGAQIYEGFSALIADPTQRPSQSNTYRKGTMDDKEEYSAFLAHTDDDRVLKYDCGEEVIVCGIATEFCVKETVLDLLKAGKKVTIFESCLGYVTRAGHLSALEELEKAGATVYFPEYPSSPSN